MTNKKVTIVDYGIGNLLKVSRAIGAAGGDAIITSDPNHIRSAERLILPGVGSFPHGMEGLHSMDLLEPIDQFQLTERPFLGICLGMQMMLSESEEFGHHLGLDMIPGQVKAIPKTTLANESHKIPLIGWMPLMPSAEGKWKSTPFATTDPMASAYFAHSFAAEPADPNHRLAEVDYNGREICAAIGRDNVFGCQFHPEMSSAVGLSILARFIEF
jgi:glutamine amidotransferase